MCVFCIVGNGGCECKVPLFQSSRRHIAYLMTLCEPSVTVSRRQKDVMALSYRLGLMVAAAPFPRSRGGGGLEGSREKHTLMCASGVRQQKDPCKFILDP